MPFTPTTHSLGIQPIATKETTQRHPLGTIVAAYDPVSYGAGEFIYLLGLSTTFTGAMVTWGGGASGTSSYQTALAQSTASQAQSLAVAMTNASANEYAWYQIQGAAVVGTNGTLAAGPAAVYLAASGSITSTAAAGVQVLNARNQTATGTPSTGFAVVYMNRPFQQGQIA